MILRQTEKLGYWFWVTDKDEELSPMFLTKTGARKWRELIFTEIKKEIVGEPSLNEKQPETVSEECTCDNCGCN